MGDYDEIVKINDDGKTMILLWVAEDDIFPDGCIETEDWDHPSRKELKKILK